MSQKEQEEQAGGFSKTEMVARVDEYLREHLQRGVDTGVTINSASAGEGYEFVVNVTIQPWSVFYPAVAALEQERKKEQT